MTEQDQDVLFGQEEGKTDENPIKEDQDTDSGSEVVARYKLSPLTLTVFENQNGFYNLQLQRTYPKDDDGNDFGYTNSIRPRDLRKAARLMEKAADDLQELEVKTPK